MIRPPGTGGPMAHDEAEMAAEGADAAAAAAEETAEAIERAAEMNRDPAIAEALGEAEVHAEAAVTRVGWLRALIRRWFGRS